MSHLKPHHYELLRRVLAAGSLSVEEVDGRVIRPLRSAGLVRVDQQRVTATHAAREALTEARQAEEPTSISQPGPRVSKLSARQEDLLREIVRQRGLYLDDVDRRTVRALSSRGLISESGGKLTATAAGAAHFTPNHHGDAARRRGRRPKKHPRAEAILKAVAMLEEALPPEAEVLVGPIMCAADDVARGFRAYARELAARPRGDGQGKLRDTPPR